MAEKKLSKKALSKSFHNWYYGNLDTVGHPSDGRAVAALPVEVAVGVLPAQQDIRASPDERHRARADVREHQARAGGVFQREQPGSFTEGFDLNAHFLRLPSQYST